MIDVLAKTMSAQKTALILGATGQVGGYLLKELLANPNITRVGEFGRRTTPLEGLTTGKDKLEQKVLDFEKPEEAGLGEGKWDLVFITLGTTAKAAGSSEAFERIDREYVINAARAAKSDSHPQRLVYLSSMGADTKSRFLYPRSKGLTEEGLASLGYEETIVFRPGLLAGTKRPEVRIGEKVAEAVLTVGSLFTSSMKIDISVLAKSIVKAGLLGSADLPKAAAATQAGKDGARFTLIGNSGAMALAKS
ncbi:hypothetical protein B0H19DRAFT_1113314 [Mycena capillaripes]|nr:hypothetical protein B0H19DRAFT_1113314 [Mycena capillaripes]